MTKIFFSKTTHPRTPPSFPSLFTSLRRLQAVLQARPHSFLTSTLKAMALGEPRRSPCHALGCGCALLQPLEFAFSPPAPHVIRRLAMLPAHHKFSDSSSGPRSTSATVTSCFDLCRCADRFCRVGKRHLQVWSHRASGPTQKTHALGRKTAASVLMPSHCTLHCARRCRRSGRVWAR